MTNIVRYSKPSNEKAAEFQQLNKLIEHIIVEEVNGSMSVQKRIECMQKFVNEMEKHRDEISNLIMWEICKSRKDAYAEFDRICNLILEDTIEAFVKDFDRRSKIPKRLNNIFAR